MLLNSLVHYYEHEILPKEGASGDFWESHPVSFAISLRVDGTIQSVLPLDKRMNKLLVPRWKSRTGTKIVPQFLCDYAMYLLGIGKEGKESRAKECFEASKTFHMQHLSKISSEAATAVLHFFEIWRPTEAASCQQLKPVFQNLQKNVTLTFFFQDHYLFEDEAVQAYWNACANKELDDADARNGICLVTGKEGPLCRLHPQFSGQRGLQGALISFNDTAFESYGLKNAQGYNASVSSYAANAYGKALKALLNSSKHAQNIGDTVILSWAEENVEGCQGLFDDAMFPQENLQHQMEMILHGQWPKNAPNPSTPFYVLGLAPQGKGRVSIKFFLDGNFGDIITNLMHHYERMQLVSRHANDRLPSVFGLMLETLPHRRKTVKEKEKPDPKKLHAHLTEATTRAVLLDENYPRELFTSVLRRIRADHNVIDEQAGILVENRITARRVMILKAYLIKNKGRNDITMALNPDCKEPSYVLGRVFAELENIQRSANPTAKKTIQSTYFSSAAETPSRIFPILFRLSQQHLAKLKRDNGGAWTNLQDKLGKMLSLLDVTDGNPFPNTQTLDEQGMFVLGYYHQRTKNREEAAKILDSKKLAAMQEKDFYPTKEEN